MLEPRSAKGEHSSNLYCIQADFGWNDLGSWAALYDHHSAGRENKGGDTNVLESKGNFSQQANGNYVHVPRKFVAIIGVQDIVVVETDDALLITTRHHSQDVGKIVKHLKEKKLNRLV